MVVERISPPRGLRPPGARRRLPARVPLNQNPIRLGQVRHRNRRRPCPLIFGWIISCTCRRSSTRKARHERWINNKTKIVLLFTNYTYVNSPHPFDLIDRINGSYCLCQQKYNPLYRSCVRTAFDLCGRRAIHDAELYC